MLLRIKKNQSRLLRLFAGLLLGCPPMLLSGCFTMAIREHSGPSKINTSYEVDAVESAVKLPNGDIALSIKGRERLTETEPLKTASFALILSAGEIHAWKERNEKLRNTRESYYIADLPAIRCEMPAAESGEPFFVARMQDFDPAEARQIMGTNPSAVLVTTDRIMGRIRIGYIEQRDDGSILRIPVEPQEYIIEKPRRSKKWLMPLAVVADVVTFPIQAVVYVVAVLVTGYRG